VIIRGAIPPAAQKGDRFDIDVRVADGTETSSLEHGWLMSARLRERAILNNELHTGHIAAIAQGSVLCDAAFDSSGDSVLLQRGRILGGGVVQLERPLGLRMRTEHVSVKTSSMIGTAINERFHDFDRGTKRGLANPTRDSYIELKVHSRYRQNVARYIQVVRHITVGETPVERQNRITELEKKLFEPTTSQRAALELEAIGASSGAPILRRALTASDPEVQFYAAESLAYLDDPEAIPALLDTARSERAFRWRAMLALSLLEQFAAQEALLELMNTSSAETRYGAFHALHTANPRDPSVAGELLDDELALHQVQTTGEPLIHLSRAKRPEIVLFGLGQKLEGLNFVFAGKDIIIKRHTPQSVKITRYSTDGDVSEVCSTDLADVIRTVSKLKGDYADIMQAINEAKSKGHLAARLEVGALPRRGRTYKRSERPDEDQPADSSTESDAIPDLFLDRLKSDSERPDDPVETDFAEEVPSARKRPWYDRVTAWMVE
ncbi:MAG: flagellar basal body P-ring protein FlgI, partial [Pirellulaceae bacterium]